MAAQAPWTICMVALLGQGARTAALLTVDRDVYQHNGSLTNAQTQANQPKEEPKLGSIASQILGAIGNQITKVETKTNSTFKLDGDSQWSSQVPVLEHLAEEVYDGTVWQYYNRPVQNDFTISFEFKTTSLNTEGGGYWFQGMGLVDAEVPGQVNDFGITMMQGLVTFGIGNPDTTVKTASTFADGAWHHVVASRTQSTGAFSLYVDGILAGTQIGNMRSLTSSSQICVGRINTGTAGQEFYGSIRGLRIYSVALVPDNLMATVDTTPAPSPASATGDPHLQNIHGERFDLMRPGQVMLINIPRGGPVDSALFAVQADARRLGGQCADLYFQTLNVTGAWADEVRAGGMTFTAAEARDEMPQIAGWTSFGPLKLKVARGHTSQGIKYLNVYVKNLGHTEAAVGGLLGEDDYTEVTKPDVMCQKSMSLTKATSSSSEARHSEAIASAP